MVGRLDLAGFLDELSSLKEGDVALPRVAELLAAVEPRPWELAPRACFRDDAYTRNLVRRDGLFDVIVLCWRPGQRTPVHDHSGQLGWVRVLRGTLEERAYAPARGSWSGGGAACVGAKVLALVERGHAVVPASPAVVTVDRERAIHRLGNPAEGPRGEDAISLHVYSRPHDACSVFDLATGAVGRRELSFWSGAEVRA